MNNEKSVFSFVAKNILNPIQSIFDLENNFFLDQKESGSSFLDFFSKHQQVSTEDPLKNRFLFFIVF